MLSVYTPTIVALLSFISGPSDTLLEIDNLKELAPELSHRIDLGHHDRLERLHTASFAHGSIVQVRRHYQDLVVLGQKMTLRIDNNGKIINISHNFSALNQVSTRPKISAKTAQTTAIHAVYGKAFAFMSTTYAPHLKHRLVIDGPRQRLIYLVHVPSIAFNQHTFVKIDALNGKIISFKRPRQHGDKRAAVSSNATPSSNHFDDNVQIIDDLQRLTPPSENDPWRLTGKFVSSRSCHYDKNKRHVATCDSILPKLFSVGAGNAPAMSCTDPQLPLPIPEEYKFLAIPYCGEAHRIAIAQGHKDGFIVPPQDSLEDISATPWPAFSDSFAEVNAYYHLDHIAAFFEALGHTPKHIDVLTNVALPTGDWISCAAEKMRGQERSDAQSGQKLAEQCWQSIVNDGDHPISGFDNAFFAGGELNQLLDLKASLYLGQGTKADFAYDHTIIYHEFSHAVAAQLGVLDGTKFVDQYGMNDSPGALNEAFADYFAAALSEQAIVGPYVSKRLGLPDGVRTLAHEKTCPEFWQGEVHQDSWGMAGALWETRQLYPQTTQSNGQIIRIFDQVVLRVLQLLGSTPKYTDVASLLVDEIQRTPELEDQQGTAARQVFEQRQLFKCPRIRPLTLDSSIERLFIDSAGTNDISKGIDLAAMTGGQQFIPYVPGPVQISLDLASISAKISPQQSCIALQATLQNSMLPSIDNPPDFLGGDKPETSIQGISLLLSTDGPIDFKESINGRAHSVSTTQTVSELALEPNADNPSQLSTIIELPSDATILHLAVVNRGKSPFVLNDISITATDLNCPNPGPTPTEGTTPKGPILEPQDAPITSQVATSGCGGCQTGAEPSLLLILLLGIPILRRITRTI